MIEEQPRHAKPAAGLNDVLPLDFIGHAFLSSMVDA